MEMKNEIATYDLGQYQVSYGSGHELLVTDTAGQEAGKYPLDSEPVFLRVEGENGSKVLKLGSGDFDGEFFSRTYRPTEAAESFQVRDIEGIGTGDLRDGLRINLHYDLSQVCIALKFDGIYLDIHCPGNPEGGDLPWFTETSGN